MKVDNEPHPFGWTTLALAASHVMNIQPKYWLVPLVMGVCLVAMPLLAKVFASVLMVGL